MAYQFSDYRGARVHLTDEVYQIILTKHPEAQGFFDRIAETLAHPDLVKQSQTDTRVNLYYRFYSDVLNGKFVVIVVKYAQEYFVSTFYATDKIKEGRLIWKR